jgi:hypothetical protein
MACREGALDWTVTRRVTGRFVFGLSSFDVVAKSAGIMAEEGCRFNTPRFALTEVLLAGKKVLLGWQLSESVG